MRDISTDLVPLRRAQQDCVPRSAGLWIGFVIRLSELLKEESLEENVLTFRPGDCGLRLAPSTNHRHEECVAKIAAPTDGPYNAPGQIESHYRVRMEA